MKSLPNREAQLDPAALRVIGTGLGIAAIAMITACPAHAVPNADVPFTRSPSGALVRHIPGGITGRSKFAGKDTPAYVTQGTSPGGGTIMHRNPKYFMRTVKVKPAKAQAQSKAQARAQKH